MTNSKIKVIITVASGMVGEGVLQECIADDKVQSILVIGRKPCGYSGGKIKEILHSDFSTISVISDQLKEYDACFFCAGISSLGINEDQFTKITYDLTLGFAKTFAEVNPNSIFCYISGAGTDSSEKGKQMWARVKGKTENDLLKLPFKSVYNFRPAFMKPNKGAKNVKGFYRVINAIFPLLRAFNKNYFLTLQEVGKAMINITVNGYPSHTIEVKDIAILANNK